MLVAPKGDGIDVYVNRKFYAGSALKPSRPQDKKPGQNLKKNDRSFFRL